MGDIVVTDWEPRNVAVARPRPASPRLPRVAVAVSVVAAHVVCAAALWRLTTNVREIADFNSYTTMVAAILGESPAIQADPLTMFAEPAIEELRLDAPQMPIVEFEDAPVGATETTTTLVGHFLPPRPESGSEGESTRLQLASLAAGRMAKVILRVEVLANGSTGMVEIERSSESRHADDAAIAYAKSLRWLPASFGDEPTAMRVRLPVVFTGTG